MKYIDTDKLIIEIEKRVTDLDKYKDSFETAACYQQALVWVKDFISSLQQEQPEVQNGKFVFPKYLYARTKDNKTIDMSYAPQDMTAVEYIRNDSIEQEQPEVDLEKDISNYLKTHHLHIKDGGRVVFDNDDSPNFMCDIRDIARHFYELGLNAKKEG